MPWWKSEVKDEPVKEAPKPEVVEDQFVTKEYFDASLKTFGETMSRFIPQTAPVTTQPEVEEEPDFGDVSDESVEQAWLAADDSGEAKDFSAARKLERKQSIASLKRIKYDNDKRHQRSEEQSAYRIGTLQHQAASDSLKVEKHYDRFKDEIEDSLSKMDATSLTPQIAKQVYNLILGNHVDDITKAELEQFVRKESDDTPDTNTRNTRDMNRQQKEDEVTPESVFGTAYLGENASWEGGGKLWGGTW